MGNHIHHDQLKLLMTPTELKGYLTDSVDHMPMGSTTPWHEKDYPELRESIAEEGIRNPVVINHRHGERYMGNGHHRVENARQLQATGKEIYVPVVHTSGGDYMGTSEPMTRAFPGVARAGMGGDWSGRPRYSYESSTSNTYRSSYRSSYPDSETY